MDLDMDNGPLLFKNLRISKSVTVLLFHLRKLNSFMFFSKQTYPGQ